MRIGEGKLAHVFWIAILILVVITTVFYQNTVKVIETRGEEARSAALS